MSSPVNILPTSLPENPFLKYSFQGVGGGREMEVDITLVLKLVTLFDQRALFLGIYYKEIITEEYRCAFNHPGLFIITIKQILCVIQLRNFKVNGET